MLGNNPANIKKKYLLNLTAKFGYVICKDITNYLNSN